MKLLILTLCFAAADVTAERINGENGWYVPKLDGSLKWVDMETAEADLAKLRLRTFDNPVTFLLYTKSNPKSPQEITASKASISASHFNPKNPTRFTIHGWTSSAEDYVNSGARDAWFTHGDMNMITVEWGRARSLYSVAVIAVPGVGEKVAALINFMHHNHELNLDTTMVIGHSLGAHVAGYTGKNVKNGQVHTIIGLDPAYPYYKILDPNKRLCSTDARYVESIHTNAGKLGFLKPIGKGAFYPNGGKRQPNCGYDITGSCSHKLAVIYYVEAVTSNNFPTMKCGDYKEAVAHNCGSSYSSVRMGDTTNGNAMVAGIYYVPVNSDPPYGTG